MDFVRLVGDEVVRLESMKVDGEKVVHTEKEVDLSSTVAKSSAPEVRPPNAPSLRRPGEESDPNSPAGGAAPRPLPPPDPLGQDGPTQPNWDDLAERPARAEAGKPRGQPPSAVPTALASRI